MIDLKAEVTNLFSVIDGGRMMNTSYDTAWLARVKEHDLSEPALDWLRNAQNPDGGWGSSQVTYGHDIIICSLAAILSLIEHGDRADYNRIEFGIRSINKAFKYIRTQSNIETVGFELLVPQMINQLKAKGVGLDVPNSMMRDLIEIRNAKLSFLIGRKINKDDTVAFSLEMFGDKLKDVIDDDNILESNGSICNSPSATVYYMLQTGQNIESLRYLSNAARSGGVPNVAQFDVFERAWALWNICIAFDDEYTNLYQTHLDLLQKNWSDRGIGWSTMSSLCDADDSGLVYETLSRLGRTISIEPLYTYERVDYFQCYKFEQNPSISANIHVLGALIAKGSVYDSASIEKVKNFLVREQNAQGFWLDKWHASPYYPTSHAIITCLGFHPRHDFVRKAIDWIRYSQRPDGSWGTFGSSQEETAYALQALALAKLHGIEIDPMELKKGLNWLEASYSDKQYPALWIGKCLYAPDLVIRSAILSAIQLARRSINTY